MFTTLPQILTHSEVFSDIQSTCGLLGKKCTMVGFVKLTIF